MRVCSCASTLLTPSTSPSDRYFNSILSMVEGRGESMCLEEATVLGWRVVIFPGEEELIIVDNR